MLSPPNRPPRPPPPPPPPRPPPRPPRPPPGASTRPVTVALPMLSLVPGGMGGSETYARELTRELARMPELDVTAYLARSTAGFSEGVPERVVPRGASNSANEYGFGR